MAGENSAGMISRILGDSQGIGQQLDTQGLFKEQGGIGLFTNPSGQKIEKFLAELHKSFKNAGGSGMS
ncbi:MAG: hypothetical protein WCL30_02445, partial [Pseudomonadota bacterium]